VEKQEEGGKGDCAEIVCEIQKRDTDCTLILFWAGDAPASLRWQRRHVGTASHWQWLASTLSELWQSWMQVCVRCECVGTAGRFCNGCLNGAEWGERKENLAKPWPLRVTTTFFLKKMFIDHDSSSKKRMQAAICICICVYVYMSQSGKFKVSGLMKVKDASRTALCWCDDR